MRIAAVDRSAAALGLAPGLTLADARARVPDLLAFDHDPRADRALLDWLVEACDRYSPSVMAVPPSALVLDVVGCLHPFERRPQGNKKIVSHPKHQSTKEDHSLWCFGALGETPSFPSATPEAALASDLTARLERAGFSARLAYGATPDAAVACARFGIDDLACLPVEALRIAGDTHVALRRAGLTTLGAVAKRPRANLAARFGKTLVDRLDRIVGGVDTRLTPHRIEAAVVVEARFAEPIARTEDMLSTLARLAGEAAVDLGRRGVGGRRFDVALFRSDGHVARLTVETAAPTRDPALVERLLRERIDALADPLDPGFGYDLVRLTVPVSEALAPAQLRLEGGTLADSELAALIDRLVTRLGRNRVRRFARADSHIPEQASFTLPVADAARLPLVALEPGEPPLRPLHLFEPPQRIEVLAEVPDGPPVQFRWRRTHHRVARFEGPERIAAEWWQRQGGYHEGKSGLTRDYYRVEDASGRRFWLFRHGLYGERTNPGWYMHGLFA